MPVYPAIPFGALPPAATPGWAFCGSGGYLIYLAEGHSPADIDFDADLAGCAQAGSGSAYIFRVLTPGVGYVAAIRAVSDAGVIEENETVFCELAVDAEGVLTANRPFAPQAVVATPAAGGYVETRVQYFRLGEQAAAASIQIALVTGDVADWEAPLVTATLAADDWQEIVATVGPFSDGQGIVIAARAVTAGGVAGPATEALPIVADATAPAAPSGLVASRVEE